jgi:hypothetical protein
VFNWSQKRHFAALSATTYGCLRALQRISRQSLEGEFSEVHIRDTA